MNSLTRIMSYDKTKENQEICDCKECIGNAEISEKREIAWDFKYADDFLIKVENYQMMRREKEISNTINTEYWYKDVKTKNFIWKSLHVHGDKYIYHKTKYIRYEEKVEITCRVKGHKSFPQRPNDHLCGKGCRICGMKLANKKHTMTTEEFIKKARKVHGDKYDYSKVVYIKYKIEVIITCKEHGDFKQTPSDHINGSGCSMCSESRGETKIRVFLENNNIKFEREKKFKNCRDKNPLPFDFYLPQYNLCIEFDGRQHSEPSAFNSKKEKEDIKLKNFEYIQNHDKIKK